MKMKKSKKKVKAIKIYRRQMVKMFFIKKSSHFFGFLLMRSTNQTKQPTKKKAERNETEGLN